MSPSPSPLPLQVVEEAGRVIVRFPAETMLSEANAEAFSRELAALAARITPPNLVIDLSGVAMLTSVILVKLIALNGCVRKAGGRLTLCNPTPTVYKVFQVARLDTVLDVQTKPT